MAISLGFSIERLVEAASHSYPGSEEDLVLAIVLSVNIGNLLHKYSNDK